LIFYVCKQDDKEIKMSNLKEMLKLEKKALTQVRKFRSVRNKESQTAENARSELRQIIEKMNSNPALNEYLQLRGYGAGEMDYQDWLA
jgi:hypothetical protein